MMEVIQGIERFSLNVLTAIHNAVVVGPTSYDGIEISYECLLRSRSRFSYLLGDFRHMYFDGFLTELDDVLLWYLTSTIWKRGDFDF